MADHNKGGFISKAQKKLTRTKTKVLQNLGKAEKTADDGFENHVHKLERQQEVAHRFQKELRNYINCAKAMDVASKSFYNVMKETYEQDWKEAAKLGETIQSLELMWTDYIEHLTESVQNPLSTYTNHFQPLKLRIAKRNRKLDYFDNARHNAEVLQSAKKKDDVKITKANEELEESKRIYEVLNNELHNELPEFHNSRVNFFATTFKSYFNAESTFHGETAKLSDTLMSITETLAEEHKQYTYQPRPLSGIMANEEPVVNGHSSDNDSNHSSQQILSKKTSPKPDRPPSSPAAATHDTSMVTHETSAATPDLSVATPDTSFATAASSAATPVKTNGEGLTNGLSSEPESPPESPQTPVPQTEAVKKGPLYENSELNYTTPSKVEKESTNDENESRHTEHMEGPVDTYEEPMVNSEQPLVNGPTDEELKVEKSKETAKQTAVENSEEMPLHAPSKPQSEPPEPPQEPPPEDDDIPTKPAPAVENKNEDHDSDHYYDKVPDQLDVSDDKDNDDDNFYEIPSSSKIPDILPDDCLYVVVATHVYKNEDEDELPFEAGELIYVLPFDDPDDQDDGWLLGMRKSDGKKGVFPENFTKRV
ncbi:myc box-dependent-interacting protein 1-like isoform X2 [Mytilus californianus]|uniref:myc box-dependent-interacting protein 1-like isoform X2 n=1 Tax=Mytilus californianus TaxID=6549 RepID=UPI0022471B11|nr:myc box-dependent-interacting protein 1-like isoform X2 [Mytilus californianus]